jgi:cell division protein FtsI/penicillin-binding protein 2
MSDFVNTALKRETDNSRVYPNGSSAAHLLGYLNKGNFAENGIEKEYNNILKGKNGTLVKKRNAKQRILGIDKESSIFPIKGNDIVLTIDIDYQKILEKSLKEGIDKFGGNSAVGIIQNPETGEILALANLPTYDPNSFNGFDANNLKNRAVADVYEPGSVIKSFTMAGLLENGIINGNEVIDTENGVCTINGAKFVDEHPNSQLTSIEILQQSSNVGTVKLSDRIENGKFYKNMRDFGFGIKSKVDLPSEIPGNLKTLDDFSGVSKYYMAVGYEFLATPIQIVTGYSALVNGGKLLKPYLLKEIVGEDGIKTKPEIIRNVISEKTSTTLKKWLVGVVDEGTAQTAKVANLSVGGKTGTAKILVNKHYQSKNNNTTFVGFFPAEKPKIVCYIWVSSPKKQFFGGTVAAPIFQDVVSNLVTLFPELGSNTQQNAAQSYQQIFAQSQKSSGYLMKTANVGDDKKTNFTTENHIKTVMPNLVGKSKKEVVSILSPIGVNFIFKGVGTIKSQSLLPGTPLKKGISITLDCNR